MDIKGIIQKIPPKTVIDALFVVATVIMGILLDWKIVEIIIFSILIWIILNPVSSRYPAFAAILFLVSVPLVLLLKKVDLADRLANYAYYFLIMTVIMGVYELIKEKQLENED